MEYNLIFACMTIKPNKYLIFPFSGNNMVRGAAGAAAAAAAAAADTGVGAAAAAAAAAAAVAFVP